MHYYVVSFCLFVFHVAVFCVASMCLLRDITNNTWFVASDLVLLLNVHVLCVYQLEQITG